LSRTLPRRDKFQSAPPVRGAIILLLRRVGIGIGFNPRPPCGGR